MGKKIKKLRKTSPLVPIRFLDRKKVEKEFKTELKALEGIAKKIVNKRVWKELRQIKDIEDRITMLKHALKFSLENEFEKLSKNVEKNKKNKKDSFFAEVKLSVLKNKIGLFGATHHKKDFNTIVCLFDELEKEVKNV